MTGGGGQGLGKGTTAVRLQALCVMWLAALGRCVHGGPCIEGSRKIAMAGS